MVRHEVSHCSFTYQCINVASCVHIAQAARAMGSISSSSFFCILKTYLNESDTSRSVREICETAIAKVVGITLRRGKDISPAQPPSLSP